MEQDAAGATGRRHLHAVPPPRPQEDTPPASRDAATDEVRALLAELDELRLLLSTDLGLAASAVDAGAFDVARDVLAEAQDDLAVFEVRAGHALRDPDEAAPAAPVAPAAPGRRQRLSVLAPALTAAAALVGVLLGVVPTTDRPATPDRSVTTAAASYAELWRLHEQGAPADRLARAARQLHAEVGRLVGAGASPAAVAEALRLLELQRQVLADPQHADALSDELAESQRLVAALRAAALDSAAGRLLADVPLPKVAPAPARPSKPAATTRDDVANAREVAPAPQPPVAPQPARSPEPSAAPAPAAGAEPTPDSSRTPSGGPQQSSPSPAPPAAPLPGDTSSRQAPSGGSSPSGSPSGASAADGSGATQGDSPQAPSTQPVLSPRTTGTLLPE